MKLRVLGLVLGLAVFAGLGFLRARTASLKATIGNKPVENNIENIPNARQIAAAPAIAPRPEPTPEEQQKLVTLNEVLAARNDNDPRLDTAFRALTPGAKALFRSRYSGLTPESRNERGTVVYLLGRNLSSEEDLTFFKQVLSEPPCRSLADCGKPADTVLREDSHLESANEVTLAYPQIVALKSFESYLARLDADPRIADQVYSELRSAGESENPVVSRFARQILAHAKSRG